MGLIGQIFALLFGGERNIIRDTAEVFRVNAEAADIRDAVIRRAALDQFGAEFARPRQGLFDRVMDGINRLPRPALALGTLGLFVSAMFNPIWFAARMQGIALVPEPLWWLMGVIVSFYFGARHQAKSHAFRQSIALALAHAPEVMRGLATLEGRGAAATDDENAALDEWRERRP